MAIVTSGDVGAATLRQSARSGGELGRDNSLSGDPVSERILAVLDDSLAGLVAVVRVAGLAGRNRGVIDELKKVLSIASNDGDLLAMLTKSVELVGVGSLDLLAGNVGQLGFGNERLGFGTDELLFEDDDLGGVGLLVLELSDLIGDLLLACVDVSGWMCAKNLVSYGRGWAERRPRCCG